MLVPTGGCCRTAVHLHEVLSVDLNVRIRRGSANQPESHPQMFQDIPLVWLMTPQHSASQSSTRSARSTGLSASLDAKCIAASNKSITTSNKKLLVAKSLLLTSCYYSCNACVTSSNALVTSKSMSRPCLWMPRGVTSTRSSS